ncbi:hypothetical protein F5984_16865 [Rudanella paleaurantiibacter]|uniref:DUF3108 domain-containing protein n=1 Tax=Rudanella paleaurantiibacter TaxID=2614655 RepID=A0A7J5TXC8_9BACT|nr:hypothetical protein [Rudanella paleaurantiibacter]KAB7729302.1 hypothetical protein F5984_16865 [Rudanella paleaurantiibacter]
MKNLLLLLLGLLPLRLLAQDCLGLTFKPGMGYEMQSYTAKDKPNGRMTYLVKTVRKEGGNTIVELEFQSLDEKGKSRQAPSLIKYTCTGDQLVADLSGMLASGQNQAFKDAEMRMKANQLAYPRQMSVGQKLTDGQMEAEFYTNGSLMMESSIQMTNRQVDGKETLTTPAGTFEVYKVSSDFDMKNRVMGIGIPVSMKSVNYRSDKTIFDVRTETYNKSGKLMAYTVLTKIF